VWLSGRDPSEIAHLDSRTLDQIQPVIHELMGVVDSERSEATQRVGVAGWERNISDARFLNSSWSAFRRDPLGRVA
jgi:hypothetical protein